MERRPAECTAAHLPTRRAGRPCGADARSPNAKMAEAAGLEATVPDRGQLTTEEELGHATSHAQVSAAWRLPTETCGERAREVEPSRFIPGQPGTSGTGGVISI